MKKIFIAALVSFFVLGISATAKAVVLVPGSIAGPAGLPVPGGAFIATITQPVAYDAISGSITQNVYLNATGYLFEYTFTNFPFPTSQNAVWRITATNYAGFWTDVDASPAAGGVMPIWLDRSLVGDSVGFQFFGSGGVGILPGTRTAKLWIQTNAQYYGLGTGHFIDGGTKDVTLYGPAVPEPVSMLLLGMGILGLFGLKRKS